MKPSMGKNDRARRIILGISTCGKGGNDKRDGYCGGEKCC